MAMAPCLCSQGSLPSVQKQSLLLHLAVGRCYTKQNETLMLLLSQFLVNKWGWDSTEYIPHDSVSLAMQTASFCISG